MNALAHELWRAIDAFEGIGKARIPVWAQTLMVRRHHPFGELILSI